MAIPPAENTASGDPSKFGASGTQGGSTNGASDGARPVLRVERGAGGDQPTALLDLSAGAVVETILKAARRHETERGAGSELRDVSEALERAVALLDPELRRSLLRSLRRNFGLAGAGEGPARHAWIPTRYGTCCEGCGFAIDRTDHRLLRALFDTPCSGRFEDTARRVRQKHGTASSLDTPTLRVTRQR